MWMRTAANIVSAHVAFTFAHTQLVQRRMVKFKPKTKTDRDERNTQFRQCLHSKCSQASKRARARLFCVCVYVSRMLRVNRWITMRLHKNQNICTFYLHVVRIHSVRNGLCATTPSSSSSAIRQSKAPSVTQNMIFIIITINDYDGHHIGHDDACSANGQ